MTSTGLTLALHLKDSPSTLGTPKELLESPLQECQSWTALLQLPISNLCLHGERITSTYCPSWHRSRRPHHLRSLEGSLKRVGLLRRRRLQWSLDQWSVWLCDDQLPSLHSRMLGPWQQIHPSAVLLHQPQEVPHPLKNSGSLCSFT